VPSVRVPNNRPGGRRFPPKRRFGTHKQTRHQLISDNGERVRSKVFVSCGQRSDTERAVAADVAALLGRLGFEPYVAIEVQSAFEINTRVIRSLKDGDCYLFVNLRRERLEDGSYRGSLFSHQEFAIAYALGFENILVINQRGVRSEGMLACLASNTDTFEKLDDCLSAVAKAINRGGWHPGYSRRLLARNLRFSEQPIAYSKHLFGYFLYVDICNRRPDIAALETTGRMAAYASAGKALSPSPIRSPLKATGRPGYSHTIFPGSHEAFDLLCVGWSQPPELVSLPFVPAASGSMISSLIDGSVYIPSPASPPTVYLNCALDVRPLPSLPISDGIFELRFEFFAIDFPLLLVDIQLLLSKDTPPHASLLSQRTDAG
jgi:hypothetical protein